MNKIILFLFLVSCGFAEEGHWAYQDGWVFKKEDPTAGGAVIEKKITNTNNYDQNNKIITEILVNPYNTTENQKIKIAEINGETIWFDPRIRPTRCLQKAMFYNNYAKTPEPNSNMLLGVGFCFLLFIRNLSRNKILILNRDVPRKQVCGEPF